MKSCFGILVLSQICVDVYLRVYSSGIHINLIATFVDLSLDYVPHERKDFLHFRLHETQPLDIVPYMRITHKENDWGINIIEYAWRAT